jgi:NADPH:quinone reductase-like Zn-dependent oxidoreductase
MKAIVQDKYGSSEVLELRDIDKPEIGDGEVLLRVRAAAVNPGDWAIMNGLPYIARPVYGLRKPKNAVRGQDVAGQVEAVGASVTRFRPGDEVFGWCKDLGGATQMTGLHGAGQTHRRRPRPLQEGSNKWQ